MGLLDQLQAPKITSSPNAPLGSPFRSGNSLNQLSTNNSPKPNFTTITGKEVYVPPPNLTTALGVRAASPTDNKNQPTNTLASTYQSTNQPNVGQSKQNNQSSSNQTNGAGLNPAIQQYFNQTPQIGGAGSGGTLNPNFGMQGFGPGSQASTNTAPGILSTLMGSSTNTNPLTQQGINQYNKISQNIADIRQQGAAGQAGYLTGGMTLPVAQGRAQVLGQTEAAQEQALGAQQQAALTAAGLGQTQQSLQQQGLGTALSGALQTTQAPYGTPLYQPGTGQFLDSSQGGFQASLQQYAQMAANGQYSAIPSSIISNPVLNAQLNSMAKQINPNYNPVVSAAQAASTASNVQTAGTAGTNAAQTAFNNSYQTYQTLQNSVANIGSFSQLLTQTMQTGGINPFDVKYANMSLANIRNQLSSGQQAQYDNTLAGLRSRVSGLLAAGGDQIPTQVTTDANKILDGSLPLSSLQDVLTRIDQEGQVLLTNQANIVNQNWSTMQSGGQGQSNTQNSNAQSTTQPAGWL